jgi:hypothetical protein
MNDVLTLLLSFACTLVGAAIIVATVVGVWSRTIRHKARRPR